MFSQPTDIFSGKRNDNIELLKAWAGTALAYALALNRGQLFNSQFLFVLLIAAVTCGLGIVLHELAHRVVARRYGAQAHFIADDRWLLISIVLAFTGFFIAAPGAVWHRGYLTPARSGHIAAAGPLTNYVLAVLFLLGALFFSRSPLIVTICSIGYNINAWLGLFNMIPAGPFDGKKVLDWDWRIYAAITAFGVGLVFVLPRTGLI